MKCDSHRETDFTEIFNSAIGMLLTNRKEDARGLLVEDIPVTPASVRKSVSLEAQAKLFSRDHFVCRYCGQRTLFVPVLRACEANPYAVFQQMVACYTVRRIGLRTPC